MGFGIVLTFLIADYERDQVWSKEALARREMLLERLAAETPEAKKDSEKANVAEDDEGVEKITKKTEEVKL